MHGQIQFIMLFLVLFMSDILQVDGNVSIARDDTIEVSEASSNDSLDETEYESEDEAFPEVTPANLSLIPGQNVHQGQPLIVDNNQKADMSSSLPLCLVLNSRSVYNKSDNLREMLHQIGPDLCLISETFERERKRLNTVLNSSVYKSISCYRKNRAHGGGCAIFTMRTDFQFLT